MHEQIDGWRLELAPGRSTWTFVPVLVVFLVAVSAGIALGIEGMLAGLLVALLFALATAPVAARLAPREPLALAEHAGQLTLRRGSTKLWVGRVEEIRALHSDGESVVVECCDPARSVVVDAEVPADRWAEALEHLEPRLDDTPAGQVPPELHELLGVRGLTVGRDTKQGDISRVSAFVCAFLAVTNFESIWLWLPMVLAMTYLWQLVGPGVLELRLNEGSLSIRTSRRELRCLELDAIVDAHTRQFGGWGRLVLVLRGGESWRVPVWLPVAKARALALQIRSWSKQIPSATPVQPANRTARRLPDLQ